MNLMEVAEAANRRLKRMFREKTLPQHSTLSLSSIFEGDPMSADKHDMPDCRNHAHRHDVELNERRPIKQIGTCQQQVNGKPNAVPEGTIRQAGSANEQDGEYEGQSVRLKTAKYKVNP
jgi:hypothetical protein